MLTLYEMMFNNLVIILIWKPLWLFGSQRLRGPGKGLQRGWIVLIQTRFPASRFETVINFASEWLQFSSFQALEGSVILDPAQGVQDILVPDSRFFISAPNIDTDSDNPFLPYDPLYQTVTGLFKKVGGKEGHQVLLLAGSVHLRNQLRWGWRHIALWPDQTLQGIHFF